MDPAIDLAMDLAIDPANCLFRTANELKIMRGLDLPISAKDQNGGNKI